MKDCAKCCRSRSIGTVTVNEKGLMPLPRTFESVRQVATAIWEEKKSRFISLVYPVTRMEEVEAHVDEARRQHPNARHVCMAYRVGFNPVQERANDDGEPAGTAGRPMLEVIQRQKLDNVLVLVVRYFGGTLLGAPGLVRAYTMATQLGLEAAGRRRWWRCRDIRATVHYSVWGKVEHLLNNVPVSVRERVFLENVAVNLAVPLEHVEPLQHALEETGGLLDWNIFGETYAAADQLTLPLEP